MNKITGFDLLKDKGIKKAVAIKVKGQLQDLSSSLDSTEDVEIITVDHPLALDIIRHSTAHLMAQALVRVYPETKIAIGPNIQDGFYYDFDCPQVLSDKDFSQIEKEMKDIIKENLKIERINMSKNDAIKIFKEKGEVYKVDLISGIDADEVTLYKQGEYVDLCRGPHLPSTGSIPKSFKLLKIAGAYWRGDSKNKMLQRIYATAWTDEDQLNGYINNLAEAEKRDHRKLGKAMDLFHTQEEAAGSIFWHPRGWTLFTTLRSYISKKFKEDGYMEVCTPQMIDRSLWEASGHWEKFRSNMFIAESEDRSLAIKPMNCPGHIQIYNQELRSYKELPYRLAEFGCCHRNEPSGSLYGTMRVRSFVQDDGHILCLPEQINSETKKFCTLLKEIYKDLGFESYTVKFSDRPEVRAGSDEMWDKAESLLKEAATEAGLSFIENKGEGAFYGPKLEFVLKDKLNREWQCGTLQVDFSLPERLNAWYVGEDGKKYRPVMIHRAVLGSLERFIGIMLEHYAGWLPMWLTPVQIVVTTISNTYDDYARKVYSRLKENGIRCELDVRAEKISYKIREHTSKKVPLLAIVGDNEVNSNSVTIRYHDGKQENIPLAEICGFMDKLIAF